jgi:hypothetical protein
MGSPPVGLCGLIQFSTRLMKRSQPGRCLKREKDFRLVVIWRNMLTGISRRASGSIVFALIVAMVGVAILPVFATANEPANDAFQRTWERTDRPVSELIVSRTWIWGPEAFTPGVMEPYAEAQGGERLVQYYDKSRMELSTDLNADPNSVWYVVNGLLATEMITGNLQLGDNTFEQHNPAVINIAGDPGDPNAPTYATFNGLLDLQTFELNSVIGATVNRQGIIGQNPALLDFGVTAQVYVEETDHTVASVFWGLMTSEGTIYENGALTTGALFQDAFFATGLPITEAYWTTVLVDGELRDVLVQAFERRIMTYTPSNDPAWRVEAGNVGRHYHEWRYEIIDGQEPPVAPTQPPAPTEPVVPVEPTQPPVNVPAADRGTVGTPGTSSLGQNAFSPLAQPYLDVPIGDLDVIGYTVAGQSPYATLNQQKNMSLVNNTQSPSGLLYYIIDFNDGSIFVSPVINANVGINIQHVWRERGTYYPKAWSIDPLTGIRTQVTEFEIIVS